MLLLGKSMDSGGLNEEKIILLFLLISTLAACSMDKNEVKDSPLYEGRDLTIGVVGKIPDVRERNIVFKSIDLNDIRKGNLSSKYDAIFIMKEHLIEAARAPYAKIYKNSGIPFSLLNRKSPMYLSLKQKLNMKHFQIQIQVSMPLDITTYQMILRNLGDMVYIMIL